MTIQKPGDAFRRASRVSATSRPGIVFERQAWQAGHRIVAGVDEVGRGAWAGPLVAAALVLPAESQRRALLTRRLNQAGLTPRDSKQLSHAMRVDIVHVLQSLDVRFAVSEVHSDELDVLGVGVANKRALCSAVERLGDVDFALIDAFQLDGLKCGRESVIGGDRRCLSIALASIVAKVHRDALMQELDLQFPGYGFARHKGYGTAEHAEALDSLGVTRYHRKSFRPVAERVARG
jgi:ribonuclease HII